MTAELDVIKLDIRGKETWRYRGRVLRQDAQSILIEAFFNRNDLPFHGITLARGDRFIEQYYRDRWYNIDEVHDPVSGALKAWYCNVARPAVITADSISYIDLALDLLVYPDGRQRVLDEDEFEALDLSIEDHKSALRALAELKTLFKMPKVFDLT
jgi:protein associated with RNAse G/E